MKKLIALLTAGLLTASIFSGCASDGESSAPASDSSAPGSSAAQENNGNTDGATCLLYTSRVLMAMSTNRAVIFRLTGILQLGESAAFAKLGNIG